MTKMEHDFNVCMRKKRYTSERFARKVAASVFERRGVVLREYECPMCQGWHLTKQLIKEEIAC